MTEKTCATCANCNGSVCTVDGIIEPPLQCPYYHSDRHYCSIHDVLVIDHEALLALADELEEDACWEVQTPGDTSGAWRLKDICDRIRAACGEAHDE